MTSSKPSSGPRQVPAPLGGAGKPANPYARFIPREELQGFAAWRPDVFNGPALQDERLPPPEPEAELDLPEPEPEFTLPPEPAGPTAEEWQARIDEAHQQGWQDGYRDGLEALEAAKRQYAQQVSAQVADVVAAFQAQVLALEERMATAVLDTAVLLARQVVRTELAQHPGLTARVAQDAVAAMSLSARHLQLHLNPDDQALVAQGAGELLHARGVKLLGDPAVARGGCVLESDLGRVDARIETRWAQAAAIFNHPAGWPPPDLPADIVETAETADTADTADTAEAPPAP